MSNTETALKKIREKIDGVDQHLCQLMNERGLLALEVSKIKSSANPHVTAAEYYRPEREAEILRRILNEYEGVLHKEDVAHIFQEIMRVCLALQQQQKIAFLGPIGTFSHACALRHFGGHIDLIPHDTIEDVFASVESGEAQYGIIPFENSAAGVVNQTLDLLVQSSLHICGEHILPIHQNLLRRAEDTTQLERIYGHSHSFEQCKDWLDIHFPQVPRIAVQSNGAGAVLAQTEKGVACIAGDLAAEIYKLEKVATHIEGSRRNATRFVVLGKQKVRPSGKDKTSLVFATPHTPGALIQLILPFHQHQVNLMAISSRPYPNRNWSYVFFMDIEGHQEDANVLKALKELEEKAVMVQVLGSYPVAVF